MYNDDSSAEYLSEQIEVIKRSVRGNYTVGTLLCVIVIAYAVFAFWLTANFTNNETITNIALYQTSRNAPKVIDGVEETLTRQAPEIAESISMSLQQAIPELRLRAQEKLRQMIDEAFVKSSQELINITNTYLDTHSFHLQQENESLEEYANRVADTLAADFSKSLDNQLMHVIGNDIDEMNVSTYTVIKAINKHLTELATTPEINLTRAQRLERLMLAYLIRTYLPDVTETIQ